MKKRRPLDALRRDAVERYRPLALAIARRYIRRLGVAGTADADEIAAEAQWGLCLAVARCPRPTGPLGAYLRRGIHWSIGEYLRARPGRRDEVSRSRLLEEVPAPDHDDEAPRIEALIAAAPVLTEREATVFWGLMEGHSCREMARRLGVKESSIRRRRDSAIRRLRKAILTTTVSCESHQ